MLLCNIKAAQSYYAVAARTGLKSDSPSKVVRKSIISQLLNQLACYGKSGEHGFVECASSGHFRASCFPRLSTDLQSKKVAHDAFEFRSGQV